MGKKTVRELLVDHLEELEEVQLRKFKRKLNEVELEADYEHIPLGRLQKADPLDLADLLIDYYLEEYGVRLAVRILESINEKKLAGRLRRAVEEGGSKPSTTSGASRQSQTPGASASAEAATGTSKQLHSGQHFVDQHRSDLIKRVFLVDPILDVLLKERVLTDEKYDTVRAQSTSQDKMRKLYEFERSWGTSDKDNFFQALRDNDLPLIKDLGGV
ncbi:apoptosis-associated speck-like protein containing a CARD isoform X2 [Rhinatrema bivittatum]|uniref:apoptosis-associated speck-like protein containing a CARD isoform X2 n=1 Tax=Rhinatrema bivittatum TaxID=194408 RepID=UPI00112EC3E3|nr:apoptosis-associated speck-like protein containing a CARD isoform X2 [Rhinatrema bivittatum]